MVICRFFALEFCYKTALCAEKNVTHTCNIAGMRMVSFSACPINDHRQENSTLRIIVYPQGFVLAFMFYADHRLRGFHPISIVCRIPLALLVFASAAASQGLPSATSCFA